MQRNAKARLLFRRRDQRPLPLRSVKECLKPESNRPPTHYECAALPNELFRQIRGFILAQRASFSLALCRLKNGYNTVQKKNVDVAILGAGPGGYPAAIRLSQDGKSSELAVSPPCGGRVAMPDSSVMNLASVSSSLGRNGTRSYSVLYSPSMLVHNRPIFTTKTVKFAF